MKHNTLINGTEYKEIPSGKAMVDGTVVREIKNGKSKIGLTCYEVGFDVTVSFPNGTRITPTSQKYSMSVAVSGGEWNTSQTECDCPVGSIMTCDIRAYDDNLIGTARIIVNGETVLTQSMEKLRKEQHKYYYFTITTDTSVTMNVSGYDCTINITEE